MISHISGQIVQKNLSSIMVDVSGIGYEILMPARTIDNLNLNDEAILYTHHHIREQSQELFGFAAIGGKELFKQLITVNGIGPKAGLAIMDLGDDENIRSAIASGDFNYISNAKGVGKKGAEKLVLELKDKVGGVISNSATQSINVESDDALDALISLGYSNGDATKALSKIDQTLSVEEKVKLALRQI